MDAGDHKGQDCEAGMNETELRDRWHTEKPVFKAWGELILETVNTALSSTGKDLDVFLKVPAQCRLKSDSSLIDKAFYRKKNYADPYNEIEDKIGVRFVVLLLIDIDEICRIIEESDLWDFDACKHFDEDKEREPLLFTYQSVHYILRPKKLLTLADITIPETTSCEVQIRTLLQHAHSELTHDAIYKSEKTAKPIVQRTVAKSMALIETTDDFFVSVTKQLNHGPLEEYGIVDRLDGLYQHLTGIKPHTQKSSLILWSVFEQIIDSDLVDGIQSFLSQPNYAGLPDVIKSRYTDNNFYQQSVVLFIYWMLLKRKQRLLADWPFERELLRPFANDIGVATWHD